MHHMVMVSCRLLLRGKLIILILSYVNWETIFFGPGIQNGLKDKLLAYNSNTATE